MMKNTNQIIIFSILTLFAGSIAHACSYKGIDRVKNGDLVTLNAQSGGKPAITGTRSSIGNISVPGAMIFDRVERNTMTCDGSNWVQLKQGIQGVRGYTGGRGSTGARGATGGRGSKGARGRNATY
jgi:hypothetical protein